MKKLIRRIAPTTAVVCLLASCGGADEPIANTTEALVGWRNTRAAILIDDSASMGFYNEAASCPYYETLYPGAGGPFMSRGDIVKAAFIGCNTASDAFIRRTRARSLALLRFNDIGEGRIVMPFDFGRQHHIDAVNDLQFGLGTPLTAAFADAAAYIGGYFVDGSVESDTPFVVIVIADGQSNGYDHEYAFACDGTTTTVSAFDPVPGADYVASRDIICGLAGDQEVHVHTIAVGDTPASYMQTLEAMANVGNGSFAMISDASSLTERLRWILRNP
ncbi:MAG: hypothetical protein RIT81_32105 [Deltaproteobacteria bacterium]